MQLFSSKAEFIESAVQPIVSSKHVRVLDFIPVSVNEQVPVKGRLFEKTETF